MNEVFKFPFTPRAAVIVIIAAMACAMGGCMPSSGERREYMDENFHMKQEASLSWPIGQPGPRDPAHVRQDIQDVDATRDK